MRFKKALIEITHDEGYADDLIMHINHALSGKDMRAERVVKQVETNSKAEGIPDGWEFVRVGKCYPGDVRVNTGGKPAEWDWTASTSVNHVVIRKIEKPKQYRPFSNAAEAGELWNAVLKLKYPTEGEEASRFRVVRITEKSVTVGANSYTYPKAFELFECVDGIPFGVEITKIQA